MSKVKTKTKTKTKTETKTETNPKLRDITQDLKVQNGIYAAEKFSDSFSISHVVNLLVRGEYDLHARGSTRGDTLPR
jgi:sulfur transfer complex TusBCD TusB component (DsrH family)